MHRGLGRDLLRRSITSQAVADQAGLHRQTFYRHWETVAEYVDELVERSLRPGAIDDGRWTSEAAMEVATSSEALRAAMLASVEELATEPSRRLRQTLLSVHDQDPELSGSLASLVDGLEHQVAGAVSLLCKAWGREPLPPFTEAQVAAVLWSFALGLVIRSDAVGRPEERALFADVVLAVLPAVTRRIGDDRDLPGHVALIDRLGAITRPEVGLLRPGSVERPLLLEVARRCIEDQGLAGAQPSVLADHLGLEEQEVQAVLGGPEEVVLGVLDGILVPLVEAVHVDRTSSSDALEVVRRHTVRLALVAARNRNVFATVLALGIERDAFDQSSPLREAVARPLVPVLESAIERGEVRTGLAPLLAAEQLSDLVLLHVVSATTAEPAVAAQAVLDLWLHGVAAPDAVGSAR